MGQRKDSEKIRAIVAEVMEEVGPEELPLVQAYDETEARGAVSNGPLGFGVDLIVPLLFPVIWDVIKQAISAASGEASKELGKKVVDRLFDKKGQRKASSPKLSDSDVSTTIARELAKHGLTVQKQELVASVVLRVLAKQGVSIVPAKRG